MSRSVYLGWRDTPVSREGDPEELVALVEDPELGCGGETVLTFKTRAQYFALVDSGELEWNAASAMYPVQLTPEAPPQLRRSQRGNPLYRSEKEFFRAAYEVQGERKRHSRRQ